MKAILYVTGIFASLTFHVCAVTPEDNIWFNLRLTIDLYKEKYNDHPMDWNTLIESGILGEPLLKNARKYLDIENRYFFPNLPTIFDGGGTRKRIILMAKLAGGEGDYKMANDDNSIKLVPGRFLIVETVDGKIDSGRFTEKELQIMFSKAGLNLKDYTFDAPPQPKREIKPDRPPDSIRRPGDPAYLWEEESSQPEKVREGSHIDKRKIQQNGFMTVWACVGGFLIAGIVAVLFFKFRRS